MNTNRKFEEDERKFIRDIMTRVYNDFKERVTTGRGKNDLTHKANRSIKEVLALPVHRRFRELLREAR